MNGVNSWMEEGSERHTCERTVCWGMGNAIWGVKIAIHWEPNIKFKLDKLKKVNAEQILKCFSKMSKLKNSLREN